MQDNQGFLSKKFQENLVFKSSLITFINYNKQPRDPSSLFT